MRNTNTFDLYVVYPPIPEDATRWQTFKMKCYYLIQVSADCPATIEYFKSEIAFLNEKQRHYKEFRYVIHPLSKFNCIYQVWSFLFYGILIYFKAFDFGFIYISRYKQLEYPDVLKVTTALDILALINTSLQFCIGYCSNNTRKVELSRRKISKRYIYSGHFFCDVLSSIPRIFTNQSSTAVQLVIASLTLLKLRRISTVFELIQSTAKLLGIKSPTKKFLCEFVIIISLVMHLMTCFHVGIPQYRSALTNDFKHSWVNKNFAQLTISKQYMFTFFKCAQYTLLIKLKSVDEGFNLEEVILSIINYCIGKLLMIATWIVLLFTFVSHRMLRVKFEEIITELNEYMLAKKLPRKLKKRLIQYYKYKYQKLFFNETLVKSVLSENLKREIDMFLCKSLIQHVSIFKYVPPKVVKQVVSYLVPQIFLPNDLVIQAGSIGDSMYFIESGTVAVYTPSGKEVCHLQDGAYFGEVTMIFSNQKRPVSIIAVEITRVYILSKKHFNICFETQNQIYKILSEKAEKRLSVYKTVEEMHKSSLFQASYSALDINH